MPRAAQSHAATFASHTPASFSSPKAPRQPQPTQDRARLSAYLLLLPFQQLLAGQERVQRADSGQWGRSEEGKGSLGEAQGIARRGRQRLWGQQLPSAALSLPASTAALPQGRPSLFKGLFAILSPTCTSGERKKSHPALQACQPSNLKNKKKAHHEPRRCARDAARQPKFTPSCFP